MGDKKNEHDFPWETAPVDCRFPNVNQTYRCFVMYTDYHKCVGLLGDGGKCNYFKKIFTQICPNSWIEKFDDQVAAGTFPWPDGEPPEKN